MPEKFDYSKLIKKVQTENPDVANASFSEAGPWARLLANKRARAIANPFTGNVTYFPERMATMSDPEAENTFTHELQHTRQIRGMNPLQRLMMVGRSMIPGAEESYGERPRELEAFQSEKDRTARLKLNVPSPYTGARDIQLPPMSSRRQNLDRFADERKRRGLID
jgi:hypothetical protein